MRCYNTPKGAKAGYDQLKSKGLQCAVVSTPQVDLELRARLLLSWLVDISAAHPAVSALVIHALVDVTEGVDPLGDVHVWGLRECCLLGRFPRDTFQQTWRVVGKWIMVAAKYRDGDGGWMSSLPI